MVKKKSTKKITDFYSENVNFSDDPEDNFYAVDDAEEMQLGSKKQFSGQMYFGFYSWELIIIIGEVLLVLYLILVLLGKLPLI